MPGIPISSSGSGSSDEELLDPSKVSALRILEVFASKGDRAGSVLLQSNFIGWFDGQTLKFSDGLQYALEFGWVEIANQDRLKLTRVGEAEMNYAHRT